ncbi:MAG: SpoIID/LytB domain-containing protein [Vicinamibacteria bacterium]|nr:SpoIID/LytB domain-containing protein [Vicinamibacteria bacterium]
MIRSVRNRRIILASLAAFCLAFVEVRCRTAHPRSALDRPERMSIDTWAPDPRIRIGILLNIARAGIYAPSGVVLWPASGTAAFEDSRRVRIQATFVPADPQTAETTDAERSGEGRAGFGRLVSIVETGEQYDRVVVAPAEAGETLIVNGAPYRGVFEVRREGGGVTVVNVVSIEDYLRGVVPYEMSPTVYPEIEALKAQAVAARTYAIHNKGQYESRGYDLCATAACQVYRGQAGEHPLTDRAVAETRHVVIVHKGKPINALFTSTCGGHTEDAENVFGGRPVPYLRGVPCRAEHASWRVIRSLAPDSPLSGEEARDAALLETLDVVPSDAGAVRTRAVTVEEVESWSARLLRALGRDGCDARTSAVGVRRGGLLAYLMNRLCWRERAVRMLSEADRDYLLQVRDRDHLRSEDERLAAALFMHEGLVTPSAENRIRPDQILDRAQTIRILARVARKVRAPALVEAELRDVTREGLLVRDGEGESRVESVYRLDPGLRLFRSLDGAVIPVSELSFLPGETARFVAREHRIVFLEIEQSRLGVSADRSSRYYRWEKRLTPREIAEGLKPQADVGDVLDVQPRRLGISGRVSELAIVGEKGEHVLHGLSIRWAFGLRESLFVVERERDPDGRTAFFVFSGKGWGHGVGLCQVGAFGLATNGAAYDAILKHYYSGVELEATR